MTAPARSSESGGFRVADLTVAFDGIPVISEIALEARPGTIVGIAGESGSGKTTAALSALGYTPPGARRFAGSAALGGRSLLDVRYEQRRAIWARSVGYVPQDAIRSLNPARTIGSLLREALVVNGRAKRAEVEARAVRLLLAVRLPDSGRALAKYPHEFSGGQAQRIAIALAIAAEPELLVLDEPTTGLDVTTQAEVLGTLRRLIREMRIAALYISHDLALLGELADQLAILYAGEIVEAGPVRDIFREPRHPYTRALLDAAPSVRRPTRPKPLPGLPPGHVVDAECAFVARCAWAIAECKTVHPPLQEVDGRTVRCLRQPQLGALASVQRALRVGDEAQRPAGTPLLRIEGLVCEYRTGRRRTVAVQDAALEIRPLEVVALVGESGSGKSTIGRAISGLLEPRAGRVLWNDRLLAGKAQKRRRDELRAIQIVFQNPDSSLNPRHTVSRIVERSIALFRADVAPADRREAALLALAEVQLPAAVADRYPHQLSGGQKQRVAIARAFVVRPQLVVCDEIVSGQDVTVQAALVELIEQLRAAHDMALLFISHDLAVVRSIADYVYVIRDGRIMEEGTTSSIFESPKHPYTAELLDAVIGGPDSTGDGRSGSPRSAG